MNRLNPFYMFRGHWKSLIDHRGQRPRAAWTIRLLIVIVPVGVGLWFILADAKLRDPGSILAALALLAGALLAAFGQLSTWRQTIAVPRGKTSDANQVERDHLDETAAHLLVAAYGSAVASLLLVIAANFDAKHDGTLQGMWAATAVMVSVYVLIVFFIVVPRLYSAYVVINRVRDELSGYATPMPDEEDL